MASSLSDFSGSWAAVSHSGWCVWCLSDLSSCVSLSAASGKHFSLPLNRSGRSCNILMEMCWANACRSILWLIRCSFTGERRPEELRTRFVWFTRVVWVDSLSCSRLRLADVSVFLCFCQWTRLTSCTLRVWRSTPDRRPRSSAPLTASPKITSTTSSGCRYIH